MAELIVDSYSESNIDGHSNNSTPYTGDSQTFLCGVTGYWVTRTIFSLYKNGTPTGTIVSKIYAITGTYGTTSKPTGSALAISDPVDIATDITTGAKLITFLFPSFYTLTNGVNYAVSFEVTYTGGGDSSNCLHCNFDGSSPSHGGNRAYLNNTTWASSGTQDLSFYVYGNNENLPSTKSVNGILIADVKSTNGLKKQYIKSINGTI